MLAILFSWFINIGLLVGMVYLSASIVTYFVSQSDFTKPSTHHSKSLYYLLYVMPFIWHGIVAAFLTAQDHFFYASLGSFILFCYGCDVFLIEKIPSSKIKNILSRVTIPLLLIAATVAVYVTL